MDLNQIQCFTAIVESGSLVQAARRTGIPKSTLSRKLLELESRLGTGLLVRTTRQWTLTERGQLFYQQCSQLLQALESAEAQVLSQQDSPQGRLKVTAPADLSWPLLVPLFAKFAEKYPKILVDWNFTDRLIDLVGEGYDVALRAGRQRDSSLREKKITQHRFVLVASPRYLAKQGTPKHPRDLKHHRLIGFSPRQTPMPWDLQTPHGHTRIQPPDAFSSNSLVCNLRLAEVDFGITLAPLYLAQPSIDHKKLEIVLPNWSSGRSQFSLVYPAQKHPTQALRAFLDFFAEHLKETLA